MPGNSCRLAHAVLRVVLTARDEPHALRAFLALPLNLQKALLVVRDAAALFPHTDGRSGDPAYARYGGPAAEGADRFFWSHWPSL